MPIRRWHYGKLIILWTWGLVLMAVGLFLLEHLSSEQFVLGSILILLIIALPAALTAVTWHWLGGQE